MGNQERRPGGCRTEKYRAGFLFANTHIKAGSHPDGAFAICHNMYLVYAGLA